MKTSVIGDNMLFIPEAEDILYHRCRNANIVLQLHHIILLA